MFEVNFYGDDPYYYWLLYHPCVKIGDGLIINLTSGASGHTLPFMIPYLASKFGVESIVEGCRMN